MKKKKEGFFAKLVMICLYYIPALIFMFMYSTVPAIPFVKVSISSNVFVIILFIAGAMLTMGYCLGGIVGIFGCVFALVGNWVYTGSFEMRVILLCSICCIAYMFFMVMVDDMKENRRRKR